MAEQQARVRGHGNIVIQAEGSDHNINVHGAAYLTLAPAARAVRPTPVTDLDLLDPAYCAVPLTGRDADLADLKTWLNSLNAISVRTVIGSGGAGKTRLAQELMRELDADVWDAGFLSRREASRFAGAQNLATWGWQNNTLIVIDYAASVASELRTWLSELANVQVDFETPRLRLLLLERHADIDAGWYNSLLSGDWQTEDVRALFDPWRPVPITPVNATADRRTILAKTMTEGARLRGTSAQKTPDLKENPAFENALQAPQWADPLMLMMAALTALETGIPEALSLSRPAIARRLADREVSRIARFAPSEYAGFLLIDTLACITLCGGLTEGKAQTIAEQLSAFGIHYPQGPRALVHTLENAQPRVDGVIQPVRPDLIGEAFVLSNRVWKSASPNDAVDVSLRQAYEGVVATIFRCGTDFAADGERRPVDWMEQVLTNAGDFDHLELISDTVPFPTLCWRETALAVSTRLAERSTPASSDERARRYFALSGRQSALGQREAALASIGEAVSLYRLLAAARPDAFAPDLASSLNNLSVMQSDLGQREAALASIGEAVSLYRLLAAARPDAFAPDLARSLNNLSGRQSDLGQREAALASIGEAVSIRRPLAAARPDAFAPDLASSLNTLSVMQSDLGQREAALASIREAVSLYRTLAAARPDAFAPDLASSVSVRGDVLASLDRKAEALNDAREALLILQPYFKRFPAAFTGLSRKLLMDYSQRCEELGQEPSPELVEPYSPLFSDDQEISYNPA